MTERPMTGHSHLDVMRSAAVPAVSAVIGADSRGNGLPSTCFETLYDQYFAFVWRNLRRLGVGEAAVADAAQDVFLVVHRRLSEFEGRSTARTWLFGIVLRVARDHRRRLLRKEPGQPLDEKLADVRPTPFDDAARTEAARLLEGLLDELDDEQRAVFVLAELEQMTAPEIAQVLSVKLNTVYSRLRLARAAFEKAAARARGDERRP